MQRFLIVLLFPICCLGQSLKGNVDMLIEQKQFVKAQDTLQTILKSKPNNLEAIELLGDVYSNQEAWDQAIEQYEKLVELKNYVANYRANNAKRYSGHYYQRLGITAKGNGK